MCVCVCSREYKIEQCCWRASPIRRPNLSLLMECHYSCPLFCYFGRNDHCGNLSSELLLVIFLANGAPCPLFSVPLSTTFFLPHIGCQAVLTMNQSLGGLFDCRWAEEVTGMHSFRSLSIGPGAFNNSLTYHFFLVGLDEASAWWPILCLHQPPPLFNKWPQFC